MATQRRYINQKARNQGNNMGRDSTHCVVLWGGFPERVAYSFGVVAGSGILSNACNFLRGVYFVMY